MRILRATKQRGGGYADYYAQVWSGRGLSGEPLVDAARLEHDDVLSLFARADVHGGDPIPGGRKNVVVLEFVLH